jgi:thioredoxin 1
MKGVIIMAIIHIENKAQFEKEVLHSDIPVLVDFFASWCGPCRMVAPMLDDIAQEREDFKICKIDVDQAQELAAEYQVMSIPTLMVFKNGQAGAPALGARPKQAIIDLVENA